MANEQTTVPLFVAAEVLTAADMNLSAGTGVPVFSNSTTRDAGFGGAGEKVLAEGQLCYLSDSNIVQYYSGASWATVGPATPGLVCVKAETAFSAVTSFTADSIFTSSYTNYRIVIRHTATTQDNITMQFRASAVAATTNYNYQRAYFASTTSSPLRASSQSSFFVASGSGGDFMQSNWIELTGPQLTASTTFWNNHQQSDLANATQNMSLYSGLNSNATAYDGMAITISGGTMTGTYTIYGYSKTV